MRLYFLLPAVAALLSAAEYPEPVRAIVWANCVACHSGTAAQGGLDLSTAARALQGGKTGAAFTPGSAEASLMVAKMVSGLMPPGPKKLTGEQIATVRAWIDAEKPLRAGVTEADVVPIFQMRCVTCHGKRKQEGGLDLRMQASRLKGGKSGPALVAGKPEESLAMKRIKAGDMPPPKLLFTAFVRPPSSEEVETLEAWIGAGMPPAAPTPPVEETFSAAQRRWWSFQPLQRAAVPSIAPHPIDAFLLKSLRAKSLGFAPPANRLALMRRVVLDLTGLIPTAQQVAAYRADTRPDAYERLVDSLLATPAYAERWAKIWLDLAGYADSEGIIHEDKLRPQAWRYRDAVIRAIERDQPYDQFITEQLAGDELSDYRKLASPTQHDLDRVAATGFLRMAPDGTYSPANGSVAERMNVIADEIEIFSSAVLGLTVGCARCHNHKYDPIPQRDYYRLSAILQTSFDPYDWVKPTERNADLALADEREVAAKHNSPIEAEIKKLEAALEIIPNKDGDKVPPEAARLRKAIADAKAKLNPKPEIRALYDMGGEPSPVFLLKRGEAQQLGERLEPDTLAVLKRADLQPYAATAPFEGTSGRRLGLARWLTQPQHPLTARVMVNRLWKHHFGRGIVETASNFGKTGATPTHPELLDWLAAEFVRTGWSMKAMHKLMVTSMAYRQSSPAPATALTADPENKLLSRMPLRRMDAEQLHDSMLLATARLSPERFGAPVPVETRPSGEIVEKASKDQWRRGIYLLQRRTTPVTMLEAFDLPRMSPNCTERAQSAVSTQALEMRNSAVVIEHARYLAGRLIDEFGADTVRMVEQVYLRALSRPPSAQETARGEAAIAKLDRTWRAHLDEQKSTAPHAATARWHAVGDFVHAILSSAEFIYVD
ncbi:MAG: DUF1553 domain-containing protein [Acidobacteria bacterium]|nr:DUF1553 domain-containing protein [Acidobacteriota bacterium]